MRPTVITSEDFARGSVSESLRSSDDLKLFVFNVQQLLRPTVNTSRRVRDYDENLGASLYEHLRSVEDLVVIADEHTATSARSSPGPCGTCRTER